MIYGEIPHGQRDIYLRQPFVYDYNPTSFHNCPNCGAPVRKASCDYCKTVFVPRDDADYDELRGDFGVIARVYSGR